MRRAPRLLLNSPAIELWPADLLRAGSNAHKRALAQGSWVMRRKRDGRQLAVVQLRGGLIPLVPHLINAPGLDAARDLLENKMAVPRDGTHLPLGQVQQSLSQLGLDASDYAQHTGLMLIAEPAVLHYAGHDRFARPLWLTGTAARQWARLRAAAARDGIALDAISGYRSHDYQLGIFKRKLARGQTLAQILAVNAAPGFSEHHSGRALDIGAPGEPPAEESFEDTTAFAWLRAHAGDFGLHMSYPRHNPYGIIYEPWHWYWQAA